MPGTPAHADRRLYGGGVANPEGHVRHRLRLSASGRRDGVVFALNSPELEILGITTVAGNQSVNIATADVLKVIELTQRTEIPVYQGAAAPLLHKGVEWDTKRHGGWFANEPPRQPPGGFATTKKLEARGAIDYLVETVMKNPGQVTILAIGPLTNIAMAMRMEPRFAANVKQIVIMGGAIASLPGRRR